MPVDSHKVPISFRNSFNQSIFLPYQISRELTARVLSFLFNMAAPEVHQLSLGPLTGVAFGPDRSRMYCSIRATLRSDS